MSDNYNDQRDEGGLFSDEMPKRENPYLKKNREKAKAEAEKAKKAEAEKDKKAEKAEKARWDKPVTAEAETAEPLASAEKAPKRALRVDENGNPRKRTFSDFMFEHVKLIASLATILVVLSLVLITDVVGIVQNMITQSENAAKEEISLTYVQGLAEKSGPITWDDFKKFRYDEDKGKEYMTWKLTVKSTDYEVWVTGVNATRSPSAVWLIDMRSGDRMSLGVDDFEDFIREHTKK